MRLANNVWRVRTKEVFERPRLKRKVKSKFDDRLKERNERRGAKERRKERRKERKERKEAKDAYWIFTRDSLESRAPKS